MSNFQELREVVLGCVSRAKGSFQAGTQNFADIAVNNALRFTQRNWDFEWNKGDVAVVCNPRGSILSGMDSDNCPTQIKRIIKAFGTVEPTGHNDYEIPYFSRGSQIKDATGAKKNNCCCSSPMVVHQGTSLYLSPRPTPVEDPYTLHFYAVKWLPPLCKPEDTNFLLTYGFDFLMYRAIVELNFFIKEDERFGVTQKMINDSWSSLIAWDTSLVSPTEGELDL